MGADDPVLAYGDAAATDPAGEILQDRVTQGQVVALDSQALSFGPKQAVDALFEPGWYDQWQELRQETQRLRQRTAGNQKRYEKIEASGAKSRLHWDVRTLESLATDYDAVMNRAANGESIDVAATRRLYVMYSLAVGVLTEDNDALDAAFLAGVVGAWMGVSFAMLGMRAQRLQELLKVLKRRLDVAMKEVTEAWIQTGLSAVATLIPLFTPLGLFTRATVIVGQTLLDTALGPSSPTSTQATAASHGSKVAEFMFAQAEINAITKREVSIAKAGGGAMSLVGLAFDSNEIFVGYKSADALRNAMAEAQTALAKLNSEILQQRPAMQRFAEQFEAWQASIADLRTQADLTRRALEDELKTNRYNVH